MSSGLQYLMKEGNLLNFNRVGGGQVKHSFPSCFACGEKIFTLIHFTRRQRHHPLGEKSEYVYIFTEIYRIAVYNSTVYFSRCLFLEMEEGYLKTYCSDLLLFVHITYGTHIKTKYMYMRFFIYVVDTVCPPSLLLETYLFKLCSTLVTEGKGSSENLPLFMVIVCRPGTNWH